MTDDAGTAEAPRSGPTWRPVAAGAGLFVAGLVVGATVLGDVGEVPCHQVQERAEPARNVLAETFGGGDEGRRAIRELAELAREHPDCFDPAEIQLLESQLQRSPDEPETLQPTVEASVEQ